MLRSWNVLRVALTASHPAPSTALRAGSCKERKGRATAISVWEVRSKAAEGFGHPQIGVPLKEYQ